jgi:hypothetical protein
MSKVDSSVRYRLVNAIAASLALGMGGATAASAATVSRSVVVDGEPSAIWSVIGPYCAIKDWLPPVGTCTEDGATPPTRTLVTKDGKATFVERQVARRDDRYLYSYTFVSSPLPVNLYTATIKVSAVGHGKSRVSWRGQYTPAAGQEKAAHDALDGIYAAGLDSIRAKFQRQAAR